MADQQQFLNVIDRDEAERRFQAALHLAPLGTETVPLDQAWDRVLAGDVVAHHNVPAFDRSDYDGFAVRAADTYGSLEETPRRLQLLPDVLAAGICPRCSVGPGTAVTIATGGMLPRGADAVVMVENTDCEDSVLVVRRAVSPGFGVTFSGTDISAQETVLRQGERLTSRETGVLAALGETSVEVYRRPRVAIISTGDEIVAPGQTLGPGQVHDSNARVLADAVRELGGVPVPLGIIGDEPRQLAESLTTALDACDVVLLSGGTSKGAGDISYRVVRELTRPGIVAHGVALKPGKPICLASHHGKPVAVLPGFPTSAIFTFHEFLAPVILRLGCRSLPDANQVVARLAVPVRSQIGRTEYLLVGLVPQRASDPTQTGCPAPPNLVAFPMGTGSGSVTTFSRADGFVTIDRHRERVAADEVVDVQLLAHHLPLADLIVIGSHCVGLDFLLGCLQARGLHTKFLAVGSTAGLQAAQRGQCDVAGIHLLDPASGEYNRPFLTADLDLIPGYRRTQGIVYRADDPRFADQTLEQVLDRVRTDPACAMLNRNQGSGTRLLLDRLLSGSQPPGYAVQPRNHNAVAVAVAQGRADWGLAVEQVARVGGLGFLPVADEHYDFVVPKDRADREAVKAFAALLGDPTVRAELASLGCR